MVSVIATLRVSGATARDVWRTGHAREPRRDVLMRGLIDSDSSVSLFVTSATHISRVTSITMATVAPYVTFVAGETVQENYIYVFPQV